MAAGTTNLPPPSESFPNEITPPPKPLPAFNPCVSVLRLLVCLSVSDSLSPCLSCACRCLCVATVDVRVHSVQALTGGCARCATVDVCVCARCAALKESTGGRVFKGVLYGAFMCTKKVPLRYPLRTPPVLTHHPTPLPPYAPTRY
eukprot:2294965-Rhodomonas_salina.1